MPRQYKEITFRGKKIRYLNTNTLARKLRISLPQAQRLEQGAQTIYGITNGVAQRFSSEDVPQFLKDFDVKRISNRRLLGNNISIGDVKITTNGISSNEKVSGQINFRYRGKISQDVFTRDKSFLIQDVKVNQIEDAIKENLDIYFEGIDFELLEIIQVVFISNRTNTTFLLQDSKLFRQNVSLARVFHEVIEYKQTDENCVKQHLRKIHKLPKKHKHLLEDLDPKNITGKELKEYAEKINCKLLLYDITGNIIVDYYPTKKTRYKSIVGINYNNHFYPLKNTKLKKINYKYEKVEIVKDIKKLLIQIIKEKKDIPYKIQIENNATFTGEIEIVSFIYDNIKYIQNDEYLECEKILSKFGLADKIYDSIRKLHLSFVIKQYYIQESINSFLPNHTRFTKSGYTYKNENFKYDYKDVKTLDKNKCYPFCLRDLTHLIVVDYSQDKLVFDFDKLIDHYLYIVKVNKSSILLPDSNIYTGKHLKYCRNAGFDFKIMEGITTKKVDNCFRVMVMDMYQKLDEKDFKEIFNIMIGSFERQNMPQLRYKLQKICNEDEADKSVGDIALLSNDSDLYCVLDKEITLKTHTQKPISVQIKDASRRLLFEKIISLGLKEEDILQINTDSISFIDHHNLLDVIDTDRKGSYFSFEKWKVIKYKEIASATKYFDKILTFKTGDEKYNINPKNELVDAMAGAGKTYDIINNLIPSLTSSYLVITPTHKSLKEYKRADINSSILQKYNFTNEIPEEDVLIIDEHGLIDSRGRDFVYKCAILNKQIISYGDYTQLPPVEDRYCNSPHYLDMIFKNKREMYINHRNHFTKEYYDEIKNKPVSFGIGEVKKHGLDNWKDADVILCFRNDIRDEYNKKKMEYLGFSDLSDVGMKVVCYTNKLRGKNIYNKYEFVIQENDGKKIVFDTGDVISLEQLEKNFRPNYATNLYGIQCESINSYYYCEEDYRFLTPRGCYVVVSRLKTKN